LDRAKTIEGAATGERSDEQTAEAIEGLGKKKY